MAGSEPANLATWKDQAVGLSDQFLLWLRAVGMSFPAVSKLARDTFLGLGTVIMTDWVPVALFWRF